MYSRGGGNKHTAPKHLSDAPSQNKNDAAQCPPMDGPLGAWHLSKSRSSACRSRLEFHKMSKNCQTDPHPDLRNGAQMGANRCNTDVKKEKKRQPSRHCTTLAALLMAPSHPGLPAPGLKHDGGTRVQRNCVALQRKLSGCTFWKLRISKSRSTLPVWDVGRRLDLKNRGKFFCVFLPIFTFISSIFIVISQAITIISYEKVFQPFTNSNFGLEFTHNVILSRK